ncbi:MAG: hypothetical protein AAFZ18_02565 [Myxococcota bacterium]
MPRIGGGGGPFVPPQAQGPQGTQSSQKSDFASKVQPSAAQGTDAARAQQAQQTQSAQLTGKAREIAKRLKKGELDQKAATREFVGLVIEERFPQLKKRKKNKKRDEEQTPEEELEEAVTELIDQDPVLAQRLSAQFSKLAAKE